MSGAKTKTEIKKLDRYPGLRPFVKEDSGLFFGRNTEILQLVDSIKVNKTLVLFGKSGLGKSSLVHAGVAPKLVEAGFLPLTIRFLDQKEEPLAAVAAQIQSQLKNNAPVEKIGNDLGKLFMKWKLPEKPVLVFDQFEEFFYYPPEKRERAISELASLLNQSFTITTANKDFITAVPEEKHKPEKTVKIDVSPRMLFLIRSDRYNMMNELAEKIPGLFNNRFELKPLLKAKAEQSIVLPGQIIKPANPELIFKAPPYRYSVEALQMILKSLGNKEEEIESSQLQILCQELEEIVQKNFGKLPALQRIVEPVHFKGENGIKEILNRFYWKQLEKLKADAGLSLSDEDLRFVRRLIENELVKGGKRVLQSEEAVREFLENMKPSVDRIGDKNKADAVIDKLLDLRLIREEESHRGKVYEISHDTLLESIIKLRDERVKQEARQKAKEQQALLKHEKMRADENEKLKKEARSALGKAKKAENDANRARRKAEEAERQAKKTLRLAVIALFVVLGFACGIYFLWQSTKEQKNKLNRISGQALLLNAARAYEDQNHALAFNLAWAADSLLGNKGQLVDSLVSKWDLKEYSGQVEVSADGSTVTCQYGNRMMELFRVTDSLRRNNKNLLFNEADGFTVSEDGTTLAVVDTVNKQFRFYKLSVTDNRLDTVRIWTSAVPKNYEMNRRRGFLTKSYFTFLTVDTLYVYFLSSKAVLHRPDKNYFSGVYGNNNSIFLSSQYEGKEVVDKIEVQADTLFANRLLMNYFVVTYSSAEYLLPKYSPLSFFYDEKTKLIFKILPDSISPVFKLSGHSVEGSGFYVQRICVYDNGYLVFGGLGSELFHGNDESWTYVQSPVPKDHQKDSPILLDQKSFIKFDLTNMVHNSHEFPLFVKKDTLITLLPNSPVRKQKIAGLESAFFNSDLCDYYLSANKKRIYAFNNSEKASGFIDFDYSPTFTKSSYFSTHIFQQIGGKDFFYSEKALTSFHAGRLSREYWKDFYGRLDDQSKKVYGIE